MVSGSWLGVDLQFPIPRLHQKLRYPIVTLIKREIPPADRPIKIDILGLNQTFPSLSTGERWDDGKAKILRETLFHRYIMAVLYEIHPDTPQKDRIDRISKALQDGAVMLYPTDTVYAIGCDIKAKSAVQRVRQIKRLANDKPLTFLCSSLSDIASYAQVTDSAYRIMKRLIPGPYTFLLPATKLVPRLVMDPKRKTTGIRVPDRPVCLALLEALGNPIISTSAYLPSEDDSTPIPTLEMGWQIGKAELFDRWEKLVDAIVDDGSQPSDRVSTILDLTGREPAIARKGLGWETVTEWLPEV